MVILIHIFLTSKLSNTICLLFPAYYTYKSIRTKDRRQQRFYLKYWTVIAAFNYIELFLDIIVSWLPFYFELKVLLVLCLAFPKTKAAIVLYNQYLLSYLKGKEETIDSNIEKASSFIFDNLNKGKNRILVSIFPNYVPQEEETNGTDSYDSSGSGPEYSSSSDEGDTKLKKRKSSKKKGMPNANPIPTSPVTKRSRGFLAC